jgi:hypothetical protein
MVLLKRLNLSLILHQEQNCQEPQKELPDESEIKLLLIVSVALAAKTNDSQGTPLFSELLRACSLRHTYDLQQCVNTELNVLKILHCKITVRQYEYWSMYQQLAEITNRI